MVAWLAYAIGDGCRGRRLLLSVLVSAWGGRLALHMIARKLRERGEDRRYAAMRQRHGQSFALVSLATVFLLPGALMWLISLPIQVAAAQPERLGPLDALGGAAWAVGIFFEAVGDHQLSRFMGRSRDCRPRDGQRAVGAIRATPTTSATSWSGGAST